MAINGIKTAREAQVVASELNRIAENSAMVLFMVAMAQPDKREATALAAQMLKGFIEFAKDLEKATEGLGGNDEVFTTIDMSMKEIEGLGAMEELFGGPKI